MGSENKIKAIREREGLTITELAKLAGISTKTINRAEHGENSITPVTKAKIVNGLNLHAGQEDKYSVNNVFPRGKH